MTLFASFETRADAERAAAALLDRGARNEDLSVISRHDPEGPTHAEDVAKHGLTTTTGADAAMGAAKGLTVGAGLGLLAALLVPGVGLVLGAGAFATAVMGGAAAGVATGAVAGYLKDQGMGDEVAATYESRLATGGAVVELHVPTGDLDERVGESLLTKYGAVGVFTSYPGAPTQPAHAVPHVVPSEPLEAGNLSAPGMGDEVPVSAVTPTRSDPVSGLAVEGYVDDPVTGARRPVRFENGKAFYTA